MSNIGIGEACAGVPTVRDRIDKLHGLLTEALAASARLCGEDIGEIKTGAPVANVVLANIEYDLDGAVEKARRVLDQLLQIERRL